MPDDQDLELLPGLAIIGFLVSAFLLTGTLDYADALRAEKERYERELGARYSAALIECLNGRGFTTNNAIVLCEVEHLPEKP